MGWGQVDYCNGEYLFKKTNDFKVSGSKTLVMTKGYYYRTKSAHTAKKGSTTESVINYSDYILVSTPKI